MTDNRTTAAERQQSLEELLPWYINGTLSERESAEVEAWLAEDADARALVDEMRLESVVTRAANDEIAGPSPASFDNLMAMIDAESPAEQAAPVAQARPAVRPSLIERLTGWLPTPSLKAAGALAGVVLVAQAVAIAVLVSSGPADQADPAQGDANNNFITASDGTGAAIDGPALLVMFDEATTMGDVAGLLDANALRIVNGPEAGFYTVVLTAEGADAATAEALAATLAEDPRVQFASVTN